MLLSFRVANFRSLLEEQELSLLPAYDKSRPAVPVAAIYGANASGKSNLLAAIEYMRSAVLDSFSRWSPDGGVPRDPFAFATDARDEESRFGVDLLLDGEKYVYGFALTDTRITEEWLYHHPHGRRRVLFERELDNIRFGDTLRGPKATIEGIIRPNSLFLSAASQHGLEQIQPVYAWFLQGADLRLHSQDQSNQLRSIYFISLLRILETEASMRSRFMRLLRAADFGIVDVETDSAPADLFKLPPEVDPKTLPPEWNFAKSADGWVISGQVKSFLLVHNTPEGPVSLPLAKESKGTRLWFNFIADIIYSVDHARTLVIDELDNSLHPLLLRELVRLFQDEKTNPHGAQLIFTTHHTSLLARLKGEEGLRRDEVWFTEKTRTGETRLYPLTDFKPRQGLNWERRYLGGSVGAIPFLNSEDFAAAPDDPPAAHG